MQVGTRPGPRLRSLLRWTRSPPTSASSPDGLVVAKLDRLTRSVVDFGDLLEWFDFADATFVALDLRLDTSTPTGAMVAHVLVVVERIRTPRDAEPIAAALELLPSGIRWRLQHVRFVAGVDPCFVGLHPTEHTDDGRSYRTTAHVCWPMHLGHRPACQRTTVVALPVAEQPWVIVHELGHALHEAIDFDCHVPEPVTAYAATNDFEAFAEAFTAWLCPDLYQQAAPILARDGATTRLFADLAD